MSLQIYILVQLMLQVKKKNPRDKHSDDGITQIMSMHIQLF